MSVRQLRTLGFSRENVRWRAEHGRLHRLHRGVYAVGHVSLTLEAKQLAAVMACGPGTVLSHRSAAVRLGILRSASRIEVTAPKSRRSRGRA